MTLIYEHDQKILKMCPPKINFLGQGFQNLEHYKQTDRQTHRQMRPNALPRNKKQNGRQKIWLYANYSYQNAVWASTEETHRSGTVERLLELRDEFLVFVSVCLELLNAPSQQSHLSLEVRELLVLTLELFTSVSSRASCLVQPDTRFMSNISSLFIINRQTTSTVAVTATHSDWWTRSILINMRYTGMQVQRIIDYIIIGILYYVITTALCRHQQWSSHSHTRARTRTGVTGVPIRVTHDNRWLHLHCYDSHDHIRKLVCGCMAHTFQQNQHTATA